MLKNYLQLAAILFAHSSVRYVGLLTLS